MDDPLDPRCIHNVLMSEHCTQCDADMIEGEDFEMYHVPKQNDAITAAEAEMDQLWSEVSDTYRHLKPAIDAAMKRIDEGQAMLNCKTKAGPRVDALMAKAFAKLLKASHCQVSLIELRRKSMEDWE